MTVNYRERAWRWKSPDVFSYCLADVCGSDVGTDGQEGYCVTVCVSDVSTHGREGYCVTVCGSDIGTDGQEGYCVTVCV